MESFRYPANTFSVVFQTQQFLFWVLTSLITNVIRALNDKLLHMHPVTYKMHECVNCPEHLCKYWLCKRHVEDLKNFKIIECYILDWNGHLISSYYS